MIILSYKLTIAYTTFNRKELIKKRCIELAKLDFGKNIEVLIIDNASTDGTYEYIQNFCAGSTIKVYKNESGGGYAEAFFSAIHYASGEYVLWVSDKDALDLTHIESILMWINAGSPNAVILNHLRRMNLKNNHRSLIRFNRTRKITADDLWGCSHGSGIIWHTTRAKNELNDKHFWKKNYPTLYKVYPNLILIAKLMAQNNCYFYNAILSYQSDYADFSFHRADSGDHYSHLKSRWDQHKELLNFVEDCMLKEAARHDFFVSLDKALKKDTFRIVLSGIVHERIDLKKYMWPHWIFFSFVQMVIKRFRMKCDLLIAWALERKS